MNEISENLAKEEEKFRGLHISILVVSIALSFLSACHGGGFVIVLTLFGIVALGLVGVRSLSWKGIRPRQEYRFSYPTLQHLRSPAWSFVSSMAIAAILAVWYAPALTLLVVSAAWRAIDTCPKTANQTPQ